ncbi:MAG: hypothetical protein WCC23_18045 [Acinetobacter calcoaceticus]
MTEKLILLGVIVLIALGLIKSIAFFLAPIARLKHSIEYHEESARGKKRTLLNIKNGKLNVIFLRVIALVIFTFFALALKVLFKFM